jgi:arginine:pyruvate transaminase
LAERYTRSSGRDITSDQILCFPGTQTALFTVLMGVAETGDEILVGDPMYATYEGVIRATGADIVPVPLKPENGFRIRAQDIAERITPKTTAILLTSPHNPTGAILTASDIITIGQLAREHDLWIISDEVYEELLFNASDFTSPLSRPDLADRVIVVSSISKSHAAPGFRSGWCVGPSAFVEELLPLSETMLFGNQPFIADMTEKALRDGSTVAEGMRQRFSVRAVQLHQRLSSETRLVVHQPKAGMFAMVNVSSTGMDGNAYAMSLLEHGGVAVMPGVSFGTTIDDWVRIALTVDDSQFQAACDRIIQHSKQLMREST